MLAIDGDLVRLVHLGLILNALEGEFVQTIDIREGGQCSCLYTCTWCSTSSITAIGTTLVAYLVFSVGDHPTGYGSVARRPLFGPFLLPILELHPSIRRSGITANWASSAIGTVIRILG